MGFVNLILLRIGALLKISVILLVSTLFIGLLLRDLQGFPLYLLNIFQYVSAIIAIFVLSLQIYEKHILNREEEEKKSEFIEHTQDMIRNIQENLDDFFTIEILGNKNIDKISNLLFKEFYITYKNLGRLSPEIIYEIQRKIIRHLSDIQDYDESRCFLMLYIYLKKTESEYLPEFISKIVKFNIDWKKQTRLNFLKMVYLYEKDESLGHEIFNRIENVTKKEVNELIATFSGNIMAFRELENLEREKKYHIKLLNIVEKILSGKLTEKTIKTIPKSTEDVICFIKYGEGYRAEGKFFPIDFLKKHGFVRPFGKWSIYFKSFSEIPQKYGTNFKKYIKDLEKEAWKTSAHIDENKIRYLYLAFKIEGLNMIWNEMKSQFSTEFKNKILEKMGPKRLTSILLSNIHGVREIIEKMEIDNLINLELPDKIRKNLLRNESKIRTKTGFMIKNITDYSKLDDRRGEFLEILKPYLRGIDDKKKKIIVDNIIENSTDYLKILEKLPLTILSSSNNISSVAKNDK